MFAGAALIVADFPPTAAGAEPSVSLDSLVAAVALAVLAFKGFTTITNTGGDIERPHVNVGRAIIISISVATVVYVAVMIAVRGNLGIGEIIAARDYSLAEAAAPVFGSAGFRLVAALAVVATVSSVMASMYSTSRMLGMMSDMDEVPKVTAGSSSPIGSPPLIVTAAVAIVLTVAFDLTRVAALGALAYLALDAAIHWGHLRHLRGETGARTAPLVAAIAMDVVVFAGLFAYKARTDLVVVGAFLVFAVAVAVGEHLHMRQVGDTATHQS